METSAALPVHNRREALVLLPARAGNCASGNLALNMGLLIYLDVETSADLLMARDVAPGEEGDRSLEHFICCFHPSGSSEDAPRGSLAVEIGENFPTLINSEASRALWL